MRRIFRALGFLIPILIGLAALGVWYLNAIFLPVKVRLWAQTQASQALGRKVTIGQIQLHLWHGVQLNSVRIQEDTRYGNQSFLEVERISGGVLWLPILKERQILIPTLHLIRPKGRILQDPNGIWNFQSLIFQGQSASAKKPKFQLLIPKVVLTDAQLLVVGRKPPSPFQLNFSQMDAELQFSRPAQVHSFIKTELLVANHAPIQLKLDLSADLHSKEFKLSSDSHIPLKTALYYLPDLPERFELVQGDVDLDLKAQGKFKGPYSVQGKADTQHLHWKIRQLFAQFPEESTEWLMGKGDLTVNFQGSFSSWQELKSQFPFQGALQLHQWTLGPFPRVGMLMGVAGEVQFNSAGVRAEELTAVLPHGETLLIFLSVLNDETRSLDVKLKTTFPAQQIPTLLPKMKNLLGASALSGQTSVEMTAQGSLKPKISLQPTMKILLRNMGIEGVPERNVRNVNGAVAWKPEMLTVTDLKGEYWGKPFLLEGSLINFNAPEINLQLSWGLLEAEAVVALQGNLIQVQNLTGRYGEISYQLFGEVTQIPASAGAGEQLLGNLYGEANLELEKSLVHLPNPPAWVKDFPVKGQLSLKGQFKGDLKRLPEAEVNLKGSSALLVFQEIPLEQVAFTLNQTDGNWFFPSVQAQFAQGIVSGNGVYSVNQPEHPWNAKISLEGIQMALLAKYFHWKMQETEGKIFAQWEGSGQGAKAKSVAGSGKLEIRGAKILEFPFMGRVADLFNIPSLRTIAFQEAEGPFTLTDGKIQTQSFLLKGSQATLTIMGSGGFAQGMNSPIDWTIIPTLAPELIPQESRSKVGKVIAKGASYLVGELKITGTWKDPKRNFIPKPMTQILNEQIFNIQDLINDLFSR